MIEFKIENIFILLFLLFILYHISERCNCIENFAIGCEPIYTCGDASKDECDAGDRGYECMWNGIKCVNKKIRLKDILDKDKFLSDVNESFNNTSSNGVMVSMNVLNNKGIVNVDGSTTILRNDSSWNIWFTPCYDIGSFMHNSARPCCFDSDDPKCQMPVGFGWIWDPNDLPHIDCVYYTDSATVMRKNNSGQLDRCGEPPYIIDFIKSTMCNSDNTCIQSMLQSAKENLNCPNNKCPADIECPSGNCTNCDSGKVICSNECLETHVGDKRVYRCPDGSKCGKSCLEENEVVIFRDIDRNGKNINSIDIQNKPSALLFVYDPNIFGSKNTPIYSRLKLSQTLQNEDIKSIYNKLLDTLDEDTYVVIMESLKLKSEYDNPQPERISPRFVEIVKLTELENHFK